MTGVAGVLLRDWLSFRRSLGRAGMLRFVIIYCGVLGYFIPSRIGNPSAAMLVFAMMPLFMAGPTAIDSFAGERERKTLETLLCSEAGNASLVAGKALFPMLLSLGLSWISLVVFELVSLARGTGTAEVEAICFSVLLGMVLSSLATTVGMHVSLKASSSRSAQQWYSIVLLAVAVGAPFAVNSLSDAVPASLRAGIGEAFEGGWFSPGSLMSVLAPLLLSACLFALLLSRASRLRVLNGNPA